ncbi:MAG: DUF4097 domain-containing protein [Ruminococcaceae bacterium]|nr:DUF4097 domain-containing protein [Oscillospiraceae bacterium]
MKKWKKPLFLTLLIVGILILAAVIIGVLNATVFDGAITFGWTNYTYDAKGYQVGDGTVYGSAIESIEVDWLRGDVEIVACEDVSISLTEESESELTDSARVRWCVSEDGKTLRIKCRKSGWFFGKGSKEKKLILRIPQAMFEQMQSLSVTSAAGNVSMRDVATSSLTVSCEKGNVEWRSVYAPDWLSITARDGDVSLEIPTNTDLCLTWESKHGSVSSDFPIRQEGNVYTVGAGTREYFVAARKGDLFLVAKK